MARAMPTPQHQDALRQIGRLERGQSAELSARDAEECCRHGWAVSAPGDKQYRLTEAGRAVLSGTGDPPARAGAGGAGGSPRRSA